MSSGSGSDNDSTSSDDSDDRVVSVYEAEARRNFPDLIHPSLYYKHYNAICQDLADKMPEATSRRDIQTKATKIALLDAFIYHFLEKYRKCTDALMPDENENFETEHFLVCLKCKWPLGYCRFVPVDDIPPFLDDGAERRSYSYEKIALRVVSANGRDYCGCGRSGCARHQAPHLFSPLAANPATRNLSLAPYLAYLYGVPFMPGPHRIYVISPEF